jgi:acetolactate synthase-1/2/3 large subunit
MNSTGADVLVKHLKINHVDTVFAITGAGNLAIIDAIVREGSIKLVYSHHEQSAVMEAQGYSRISGKIGIALVTTGGGTSNVVTGVLSAHLDSVPVLIISGNESSFHCLNSNNLRAYGVQGFDSVSVLTPITKFSERITKVIEVSNVFERAVIEALSGRPGPVHIDFPMDLQRQKSNDEGFTAVKIDEKESQLDILTVAAALAEAKQPIFYFGNGCRKDILLIRKFLFEMGFPYAVSWSALDLFDHADPMNIGTIGIYGSHSANILLQKSDLVVCVGTRLAIPQIGYDKKDFGRLAKKIIVDIDQSELEKFIGLDWLLINHSSGAFTQALSDSLERKIHSTNEWREEIQRVKKTLPLNEKIGPLPNEGYVHSAHILEILPELLSSDAIIVTDVGAPLLNGHYIFKPKLKQRFFTSQGLGEMGFGLPAAIGAYFASPDKQIVCLNTDGALMFNVQELQVVKHHKIPMKLFIFNNGGYGMIKISQENLFDSRISGSDEDSGISFPDFEDLAMVFGFNYTKITSTETLIASSNLLANGFPQLFDISMDPKQKYFPRLATNKLPDGSFVSPPIEDLTPLLEIETLANLLGYSPTEASFEIRGISRNGN